jgi:prophage antirepressor-like protein/TolA-binding protein
VTSYCSPATSLYSVLPPPPPAPLPHYIYQPGPAPYLHPRPAVASPPYAGSQPYHEEQSHAFPLDSVFAVPSGSAATTNASSASSSTLSTRSLSLPLSSSSSSLEEQVTALSKEIEHLRQDMLAERDKRQAMQKQHRSFLKRVNIVMQQDEGNGQRQAWGKSMWDVKKLIDEEVTEWLVPGRLINGSRDQSGKGGGAAGGDAGTASEPEDQFAVPTASNADDDGDDDAKVKAGVDGLPATVKYRLRTVDNCRPGRLIVSQSRRPIAILHVEVQKQFTVSKRETTWMRQEEREKLVNVPVRIMGATRRDHLYFVARDVCLLIHTRKGNVAKSVGKFDDTEKARMPVLCQRSNGIVSTNILTVLTISGVKHVLHSSRSPLAPQVLKWLLEQVEAICNAGSQEQAGESVRCYHDAAAPSCAAINASPPPTAAQLQ